ncbi:exopolyphosphatase [Porphyromonas sp. COT-239 OH1446]|uniref:Ppx/GppA phosphatase family protein n=1 Tax=Porphyromonas sp. COT-239 OH1446 TaxID=1515613 RepID=UPI00052D419A|nr:exopolyphosphatase [Porphyromonas sp. COT-239 OH1446]KGN70129.1 exopolyphosphatase [Porphyromonas sp. COT-239 OH1446]
MSKTHYAAIDIGSNAIRLLIKCVNAPESEERMSKVQLVRVPIRLGEDAFVKGRIGKKKARQMLSLMNAYKELMAIYEVEDYRACATSAMRDADNGPELCREIMLQTGIRIEILDGREEAKLISSDLIAPKHLGPDDTYLYVDVGGGSTELNIIVAGQLVASHSFDIGTVRSLNGMVKAEEWAHFAQYLRQLKDQYGSIKVVGSGGNINKLLRLGAPAERSNINFLPLESLHRVARELKQYDSEGRMIHFRLKPDRAEVIVPAADIFLLVGDTLAADGVIVPAKGLSDGIIDSIYRRHQQA